MNTHITTGWNKATVFADGKDSDMNTVLGYIVVPFTVGHGGAGAIARIIELARLKEMYPLYEKFYSLTGYSAGVAHLDEDEINLLAATVTVLHKNIRSHISQLESKVSLCDSTLETINKGGISGTGDYIRNKLVQNQYDKERSQNQIYTAEEDFLYVESVISLLRSLIECMKKENPAFRLKTELPKPDTSLTGWSYFSRVNNAGRMVLEPLDAVEKSLRRIIDACTSVASNVRNNEEKNALLKARAFYYSREGELLRSVMTRSEYICSAMSPVHVAIKKGHKMECSFSSFY
ncbi:hypothetical protein [Salmonella enterica]|uniref:hypothetical protein n=1 Tax=Salmonella enterica TaxID=28901 RepID=UPI0017D75D98|nr:hypothetical protein [Salmonella enterica]